LIGAGGHRPSRSAALDAGDRGVLAYGAAGKRPLDRGDEISHPAAQRAEHARVGAWGSTEIPRDAAALARRLHKPGKHRAHRQPLDVARMDAAEQRLGDEVDGGGAEPSPEERRHGFVFGRRLWNERLERHAYPRPPVQQVVSPQRRE